ncbi:MAG: hypothetical protein KAH06_10425, partial [Desulfobacterales bacterium]|nr:hypothetical protein [Desulfobacterales bacterium]
MSKIKVALVEAISASTHVYSRTYLPRAGVATLGAVLKKLGYSCEIFIHLMSDTEVKQLEKFDV